MTGDGPGRREEAHRAVVRGDDPEDVARDDGDDLEGGETAGIQGRGGSGHVVTTPRNDYCA